MLESQTLPLFAARFMTRCSLIAITAAACLTGAASASLQNGNFDSGGDFWNGFGGHGVYDYGTNPAVPYSGNAAASWGDYGWSGGYSGFGQDLTPGSWSEGDTINFGAEAFIEN